MPLPKNRNGSISRSELFIRPDMLPLEPIPEEVTSMHQDLNSRKKSFHQCFLIEDSMVYVTYLHVFYLFCLLIFLIFTNEYSSRSFLSDFPIYPAAGCFCLFSVALIILANRASEISALLIPLIIWQVLVTFFLLCGGAYLIHHITVMSFASVMWRTVAWSLAFLSALLFTAFHIFAILLTFKYFNFIRGRKFSENEVSVTTIGKIKVPLEGNKTFDQPSIIKKVQPSYDMMNSTVVSACSSPINNMATVTISEPIDV